MDKTCELCQAQGAWDTRFGIQLCQNCLDGFESVMKNDIEAIRKYANEENYPNATENAKQQVISLAKRKLNSGVENLKPRHVEKQEEPETKIQITQSTGIAKKNATPYRLKYKKVLSTEEKREWIDKYIGIKRFVAGVWAFIGLGLGFVVARILGYGMDVPMFVFLLIGGGIGGALGTNAVGTAMMEAITAEQNIVTEELLTEILNNTKNE